MSAIHVEDHWPIFIVLLVCVVIGILGDHRGWFGKVSGILITIALAALATSTGLLPSASDPNLQVPAYQFVYNIFVPLSIPLLLFNAHLKKILRESGRLLLVFLFGSMGIVIGAILATWLINFGAETYKIAGVFVGTYTGGSVNFLAVASTLDFLHSELFPTVITIDNAFTNLYFILLFGIPSISFIAKHFPVHYPSEAIDHHQPIPQPTDMNMQIIAVPLTIAAVVCGVANLLSPILQNALSTDITLDMLIITLLITIIANIFPNWLEKYERSAFSMGMFLMYLFLAVIGAACDVRVLLQTSFQMLAFVIIILSVHLIFILIGGKLLRVSLQEVLVASAANAGGPSIAAPMAANFGLHRTITPAILIGILGYLIGTFLGVSVGLILR